VAGACLRDLRCHGPARHQVEKRNSIFPPTWHRTRSRRGSGGGSGGVCGLPLRVHLLIIIAAGASSLALILAASVLGVVVCKFFVHPRCPHRHLRVCSLLFSHLLFSSLSLSLAYLHPPCRSLSLSLSLSLSPSLHTLISFSTHRRSHRLSLSFPLPPPAPAPPHPLSSSLHAQTCEGCLVLTLRGGGQGSSMPPTQVPSCFRTDAMPAQRVARRLRANACVPVHRGARIQNLFYFYNCLPG
jgi:hypothetical protein